ncbi:hypothetical protein [Brachyspira sp.]|uniref:hypothetical protein n=1 Tax=Brachyspira sp. TaxID=1977261 RepID=UPI002632B98D|nr:hypothetical protein [Brachyspira sp.]
MAAKESKTSMLEKRLNRLELQVGYNEDGTKNGNGIIHKVEEVKEEIKNLRNDIKSYDTYLDNLSEDFVKTDLRIEQIDKKIDDFIESRKRIYENLEKQKREIEVSVKEIKEELKGNITMETLKKVQKAVIGIAGLIGAVTTIIGALLYFTK